jgi:hypothetical protein
VDRFSLSLLGNCIVLVGWWDFEGLMFVHSVSHVECHFCNNAFMALLLHVDLIYTYMIHVTRLCFRVVSVAIRRYILGNQRSLLYGFGIPRKWVMIPTFPCLNPAFECLCPRGIKSSTDFREWNFSWEAINSVKKSPSCCRIRRFVIIFTIACYRTLFRAWWAQSIP